MDIKAGDIHAREQARSVQVNVYIRSCRALIIDPLKQEDLTIELAKVYAQLGENDRAFAWLEEGIPKPYRKLDFSQPRSRFPDSPP